jgi:hypothetical protein
MGRQRLESAEYSVGRPLRVLANEVNGEPRLVSAAPFFLLAYRRIDTAESFSQLCLVHEELKVRDLVPYGSPRSTFLNSRKRLYAFSSSPVLPSAW